MGTQKIRQTDKNTEIHIFKYKNMLKQNYSERESVEER